MDETWLYHYDPETKQQSMEWRHSGLNPPPNPSAKIVWKSPRLNFLLSRRILLIDYLPKGQTINTEYSAGSTEGHFEGKMLQEGHQMGLVLERQCPCSPVTFNPEETGLPRLPVS